jgi:2-keto-4-pentenoate hydratase/2-oxohepta-3-ene-1,7-dioic acid hydratase in catechol pathway
MIFHVPTVVSELSAGIMLRPGDVIATGTPAGVGVGYDPPRFLQPGDVVEIEIEGIGTLRNPVGGR